MSYCIIGGQPVFLYPARYKEIREQALRGKDATHQMADIIAGTKEGQEVDEFVSEFLRKQYEADPVNFRTNWASFDLNGEEAVHEVWDLLTDYCRYYGYGYLSDLRHVARQLVDEDAEAPQQQYPAGRVFALNYFAKPMKWWWPYTRKMKGRTVSLVVVASSVYRLVGDLTNFTVYAKDLRLNCGPNLGIYPSSKERGAKP
jgi:hypothetical protein